MLSACSETCSRLLTSVATAARERSGRCAQMASASLCHRSHRAALVATRLALARAKLRPCFGVVGWSSPSMLGSVVQQDQINGAFAVPCAGPTKRPNRVGHLGDKSGRPWKHTLEAHVADRGPSVSRLFVTPGGPTFSVSLDQLRNSAGNWPLIVWSRLGRKRPGGSSGALEGTRAAHPLSL